MKNKKDNRKAEVEFLKDHVEKSLEENQNLKSFLNSEVEKQLEITTGLVKSLNGENEALKQKIHNSHVEKSSIKLKFEYSKSEHSEEKEKLQEDMKELLNEMDILKNENEVKKELLEKVEKEIQELREKAANNGQDKSKSLSEELGIQDPRSLNVSLECSMCRMGSSIDIDMKDHKTSNHCAFHMKQVLKRKIIDFGKENTKKRMNLKSSILKMKERELKENVFCKSK